MAGLLRGRLAIVTGAGGGIGEAVCHALLREGSRVAAVDINAMNTNKYPKSKDFRDYKVDVTSKVEVDELMENIQIHFDSVPDSAVNCAGIVHSCNLFNMSEKQFDDVIKVNLKGTYLICQGMAKAIMENRGRNLPNGGSIVNISSIFGKSGHIGVPSYVASKAGVIGLTKAMAKELGHCNIRCNALLPGFIITPMTDNVPEEIKEHIMKNIPLGRFGKPEEVAELCAFLLSDKSSYITGSSIEITGGWSG